MKSTKKKKWEHLPSTTSQNKKDIPRHHNKQTPDTEQQQIFQDTQVPPPAPAIREKKTKSKSKSKNQQPSKNLGGKRIVKLQHLSQNRTTKYSATTTIKKQHLTQKPE